MSKLLIIVIPIGFVVAIWFMIYSVIPKHAIIGIDCTIAEISPDIPVKVKEECRKKKSGRI